MKTRLKLVGFVRKLVCFVAVVFILNTIGSKAFAFERGEWTGNVNLLLGFKSLEKDDWEPVEQQMEFGIDADFKQQGWPVSVAVSYLRSSDDDTISGVKVEGKTSELNIGIRMIFEQIPNVSPFIGGGVSYISAEVEASATGVTVSFDDSSPGFWFGWGAFFTMAESFNMGFLLNYSKAEVTISGTDGEAGGLHYGLFLGYHW